MDMKPSDDFTTRLSSAREWRDNIRPLIEEVYRHCAPGRQNEFTTGIQHNKPTETDVFHSLGEEMATDLGSDLVTYFTPSEAQWLTYTVMTPVAEDDVAQVTELVNTRVNDLFDFIQSSNYNDIAPQWGNECAMHGTPALWVTMSSLSGNAFVETVPPCELLITPGFMGVLDRFREKNIAGSALEAALAMNGIKVDLTSPPIQRKLQNKKSVFKVCWGFWVDWSDPVNAVWRMEITVDGKRVTETGVDIGSVQGNCPLLVGRFNPQPNQPWGRGSGIKALPDFRTLDTIDEVVLTGLDASMKNTLIYPNDSFLDLSDGLEHGRSYPAGRGFNKNQIFELNKDVNLDMGMFTRDQFENRIRTAHYQDGPRQTGDTPPTATQWVDERRRVQQRLGKPSAPLWSEMIVALVQRFERLAIDADRIAEALSHNEQDILLQPLSPLQKAQNNDQVMVSRSNMELGMSVFGEGVGEIVDGISTFRNVIAASGDKLTVIRESTPPATGEPQNEPAQPPQ